MARYTIDFTSKNHPTNRDVVNVGLRVAKDDAYLQFFLAMVSGSELSTHKVEPDDRWWSALAACGVDAIRLLIDDDGFAPLEDPTHAIPLAIPIIEVQHRANGAGGLPTLTEGLLSGHQIASFVL